MSNPSPSDAPSPRRPWLLALPLVGFVALAALFWFGLREGDPSKIPSALIGHAAPQTTLPALDGLVTNGAQANGPRWSIVTVTFNSAETLVKCWSNPGKNYDWIVVALLFPRFATG